RCRCAASTGRRPALGRKRRCPWTFPGEEGCGHRGQRRGAKRRHGDWILLVAFVKRALVRSLVDRQASAGNREIPSPSFPRKRGSTLILRPEEKWIPAFAGMTNEVEWNQRLRIGIRSTGTLAISTPPSRRAAPGCGAHAIAVITSQRLG